MSVEPAPAAEQTDPAEEKRTIRPDWWHRDHPVFGPLSGFFTGMVFIIVVPGLYATILKSLVGYARAEELFPFVVLTFAVPIGLLVPRRTRQFARYMLLGTVATAVVVLGVAAAVLWLLIKRDS
ncbi:hypothetical protein [Nocardioides sambongensis]|uniref:hypothetical protein n=1 Tax=Nocardioides sambongensis TaxID=2589074 RepID=UPI001E59E5C6|nr:hypothetical protein [Nocardioides sambongensis]